MALASRGFVAPPLLVAALLLAGCGTTGRATVEPGTPAVSPAATAIAPAATATEPPDEALGTAPPSLPPEAIGLPSALPGPPVLQPSELPLAGFALHVPILMYHRIVPPAVAGDSLPGLVVPPDLFAAQLAVLRQAGWHTVTLSQLSDALAAGRALPPRSFAITIDDGWDDGYTYALPILRADGFSATYFVVAGRVGRTPGALTPAHLRDLVAAGMQIGDHTLDHVALPGLDPARLQYEVMAAAVRIRALAGGWPIAFAYPYGRFDQAAMAQLRADRFALAVTTEPGTLEAWSDRLDLPRVRVGPGTAPLALLAELRREEGG